MIILSILGIALFIICALIVIFGGAIMLIFGDVIVAALILCALHKLFVWMGSKKTKED